MFALCHQNENASELSYSESRVDSVIADTDLISAMAVAGLKEKQRGTHLNVK